MTAVRKRTDIHRPSAINPADYEFVGFNYLKSEGIEDAVFLKHERQNIRAHFERTGGTWSHHDHGGNCDVCGSVNCIYTAVFYHAKTNTYIRTGLDCADNLTYGDFSAFKKNVKRALEAKAGKAKAQAILAENCLTECWNIFTAEDRTNFKYDENTIVDIVAKLVQYGNISERATSYLHKLLDNIANREKRAAQIAAEKLAALPVPAHDKRIFIRGKVISIKHVEGAFGPQVKMLVQHRQGWKVYGTIPSVIHGVERGQEVEFEAKVQVAKDDPKFGFFSRPTKALIVEEPVVSLT